VTDINTSAVKFLGGQAQLKEFGHSCVFILRAFTHPHKRIPNVAHEVHLLYNLYLYIGPCIVNYNLLLSHLSEENTV